MNGALLKPLPGTTVDPRYPDSDGRFMGETDYHNIALIWLREGVEDHFKDAPRVYVASNLVFYYQQGDPSKRKDPDVLVAKNVGKHRRRSYRLWEEKVVPSTLFEIASKKTWRNDIEEKRHLYAQIKVAEYFVFDPEGKYLHSPLLGFRTVRGKSVPIKPNPDGSLTSKELGLRMIPEGAMLRLIDIKTGKPIPTREERAELEKRRADQAELEHLRAEAEKERMRAEVERYRAEQERMRAEQERIRAEMERLRREALAVQVENLRAKLDKLEPPPE